MYQNKLNDGKPVKKLKSSFVFNKDLKTGFLLLASFNIFTWVFSFVFSITSFSFNNFDFLSKLNRILKINWKKIDDFKKETPNGVCIYASLVAVFHC